MIKIRDIAKNDYGAWHSLWLANNKGQCNEDVTAETWNRLLLDIYPVHGLVAELHGKVAGLLHYILHPVTGHIQPVCYMQDVFVDEAHRKQGIGTALIQHLASLGQEEEWARLYWLVEHDNKDAQNLYTHIGLKLNFSLFVHPLGTQ